MSASLVDNYMIAHGVSVVKNFFKVFATFFSAVFGACVQGFLLPFTPIILTDIPQNARVNIAQNARGGFMQFAGVGDWPTVGKRGKAGDTFYI